MKRVFSLFLCIVMFVSCFSLTAFAVDPFNLTADVSENSVTLKWEENTSVSRYHVYRSTSSDSGFQQIAVVTREQYKDENLSEDTAYFYKVCGSAGTIFYSYTDFSDVVSVTTDKEVSFELNKSSVKLGAGETYQLEATNDVNPTYSSSNKSVATVDKNGKVTTYKKGVAVITAEYEGVKAECKFDVRNAPKKLSLGRTTLTLGVGETYKFKISSNSGSASLSNKYTSSDKSVAVINSSREVTALKAGKTTITMTAYNGVKTTCVVTVKNEPVSVRLNYKTATISMGGTVDLNSFVNSGAGAYSRVYTSSNENIVTVDKSGIVKGLDMGKATVTLTLYNGVKAKCDITVEDAPYEMNFKYSSLTMGSGEVYKNKISFKGGSGKDRAVKFVSSDPAVLSVSDNGTFTAKKTGKATVTATDSSGLNATCTVTVKNAPSAISINTTKKTVFVGEDYKLSMVLPKNTACLQKKWTSSNPEIAKVDYKGLVTPLRKGTVTITAESYNGKKVTSTLTVRIVNFKKAYTSAKVRADIEALEEMYPALIKTGSIGKSVKGADIPLVMLGRGERKALITAGIHSREYLTIAFTMRCIEDYAAAYYSKTGKYGNYDMVKLLDEYTLYIVPMINPDGLDAVTAGQKTLYDNSLKDENYKRNANGVNLNRNFPFEWEKVTDGSDITGEAYKGKSAGSEPETQALMKLCDEHEFEWLYSMHLYGNNIFWRDSKNGVVPGDEALVNKLNKVCVFSITPSTTTANGYGGGFENWFRQTYNRPGFCVELVPLDQNYRYEIARTKEFDTLTNWSKTKYAFIQGMI